MKGLDLVGFALLFLSFLLVIAIGVPRSITGLGGYSLNDLVPLWPALIGVICIIAARFTKGKAE